MKKLILTIVVLFGIALPQLTHAQINLNVNVSGQPLWGPTGYDHVDYYYLPDIDTYYSVADQQYVYQNNNKWMFSNSLPSQYSSYNLYNGYKVVLNGSKPYLNWKNNRVKYASFKGKKGQPVIKYSKDPRYTQVIHANKNGIPPGQAKKISPAGNQRVVIAGSKGNGKRKNKN
jgi:hypothetical protein